MGGFVTTNIRLPEEEWKEFKLKALEERKSLSCWLREKAKGKPICQPKKKTGNWAESLLVLANNATKSKYKDLSINHDKYLYGQ